MPLFYFHVRDGQPILEAEPVEFAGPDEAGSEAVQVAGALLRDLGRKFWEHPDWRIWVTDEATNQVCAMRFVAEPTPRD